MNRIFVIVALALISAGCTDTKETVITGLATGISDSKSLVYAVPLSGTSYDGFTDTIDLDETGNFELKFKINKSVFINVRCTEPYISAKLLVEPGNNYHIAMDISKKNVQISGANEKGQMLYATLPNPGFIEMEARRLKLLRDTSLVVIHDKIEELKQADMSKFQELLDNKEISQSFFDLVSTDRDCYYASLEARISIIKTYRVLETKQFTLPNGENLLENLTKIYTQYSPDNEKLIFSSFWSEFAKCYITDYKYYTQEDFDIQKLRKLYEEQTLNTFFINESKKYLTSNKALEFFQATYLYFTGFQKDHKKELISLYEQFTKDYPNSEYSKYLKPEIDEIVQYYQIVDKPFDENMRFADNYEAINTLEEAIKPLKGKKIYIDVWATWCGPCKREFKHQKAMKKILDEQDIQQLYISIDKDENDRRWKDAIKFYGLSGMHIRVNKELSMDLFKRYDRNAETPYMNIPWYLLVDENGNIVKEHAESPSEIVVNGLSFNK
jgi:thiol-disulfide isomerase/thioredoxin